MVDAGGKVKIETGFDARTTGGSPSLFALLAVWALVLIAASPALAEDLTSANYRHRAGGFSSSVSSGLTSTAPASQIGESAASVGASVSVQPSGSSTSLASILPGFWLIVKGALPTLDLDGDLAQFFLDEDDDGDGLLDVYETGTGIFVSGLNTGSSPVASDSDADGFADGVEVAEGTDPNDDQSFPAPNPEVPSFSAGSVLLLLILLWIVAVNSTFWVSRKALVARQKALFARRRMI